MPYDLPRHNRRSIRLAGYDYSAPGSFFITICTHRRECLLGDISGGTVVLNPYGEIVQEEWRRSAKIRAELEIDAYAVMPNHLHGIFHIAEPRDPVGAHGHAPLPAPHPHRPVRSVGSFIGRFKGAATRRINTLRDTRGTLVWQRNYYEQIVRDENDLQRVRAYIEDNPSRWAEDEYHPAHTA